MSDLIERRADRQPGLFQAAENACIYRLTDGFCSARNVDVCRCWDAAQKVQEATGLSARAVAWIFRHLNSIELHWSGHDPKTALRAIPTDTDTGDDQS